MELDPPTCHMHRLGCFLDQQEYLEASTKLLGILIVLQIFNLLQGRERSLYDGITQKDMTGC